MSHAHVKADGGSPSVFCVISENTAIGPECAPSGSEHATFPEHNFDNVIKVGLSAISSPPTPAITHLRVHSISYHAISQENCLIILILGSVSHT